MEKTLYSAISIMQLSNGSMSNEERSLDFSIFCMKLLDFSLDIFHTLLILFVLFAWVFKKTRRLHPLVLSAVLFSWLALGYFYGWGYCILTDWHWSLKRHLGETNLPSSFIGYVYEKFLDVRLSDETVNVLAYSLLLVSIVMSALLNIRDLSRRKRSIGRPRS